MEQASTPIGQLALRSVVTVMFLFAAVAAHAQDGTRAQRKACEPDVFRLCAQFIPDHTAITDCLERNRAKLSPACHAVFSPQQPSRE